MIFQAIVPFCFDLSFWLKVLKSEIMSIALYMILSSVGFCFDYVKLNVLESEHRFFSCHK